MLFKTPVLERIRAGEITLAFRRWQRPPVKTGGQLRTPLGILDIEEVEPISVRQITAAEARRAGYVDRKPLIEELRTQPGELYRIRFSYAGEDPRASLQEATDFSEKELKEIQAALEKLDTASDTGAWTLRALAAIRQHPMLPAEKLAPRVGREKEWFKRNVTKLKDLGLTISHASGYSLSPRGEAFIQRTKPGL